MNILVCIKQVPVEDDIKVKVVMNTIDCGDGLTIMNPCDGNAVKAAVIMKEKNPEARIIVVCVGPNQARNAVKACFENVADKVYMISDCIPDWDDTSELNNIVNDVAKKLEKKEGKIDLIFCEGLTK
ncbi:MAG: hypothetical protein LUF92_17850 [Clostridiales bacterium]|nr:hypothetical protein [Clostridiales bacterium]